MKRISIGEVSPNIGDAILAELSAHMDLPTYGIIGGQSVASIVIRMLGISKLESPINDIDVFIPVNQKFTALQSKMSINESRILSTVTTERMILFPGDEYQGTTMSINKNYRIINSERFGIRNNIYVEMLGKYRHMYGVSDRKGSQVVLRAIVEDFDINGVQCGVDLVSRRFYATKSFLSFLRTLTLEITNFKTPVHSIIRLAKKGEELNVGTEMELNSMIVEKMVSVNERYYAGELNSQKSGLQFSLESMGIMSPLKKSLVDQPFVFGFGDTYHRKYMAAKKRLDSVFELVTNVNDIYDTYTFKSREKGEQSLDRYIHLYINGLLYGRLERFQQFSRYARINLLLKNIPTLIRSSIEKKNHFFLGEGFVGFKGADRIIESGIGSRGVDRTILSVRQDEFSSEGERMLDDLWDSHPYSELFHGLGGSDFMTWLTITSCLESNVGGYFWGVLRRRGVFFKDISVGFLLWLIGGVPEEVEKKILSQAKANILFDIIEADFERYIEAYLENASNRGTHWILPSMELNIIEYLEKVGNFEDAKSLFLVLSNLEGQGNTYSPFLMASSFKKMSGFSMEAAEFLKTSKCAMEDPFLRELVVSEIVSTQVEFLEFKASLRRFNVEYSDYELNGYLLRNDKYSLELKDNIVEVAIAQLNASDDFDERLFVLLESFIEAKKGDSGVVADLFRRVKNAEVLVMMVEKLHKELDDETVVKVLASVSRREVFFYLKDERLKNTLEKIGF